jgi:two-component system LytT family sensor kinase
MMIGHQLLAISGACMIFPRMQTEASRTTSVIRISLILLALWTVFGFLSSTHFFFRDSAGRADASFSDTASVIMVFYWLWALLTPPVVFVARRAVRRGAGWGEWSAVGAMALAVIVVHGILFTIALRLLGLSSTAAVSVADIKSFAMKHGGGDLATFAVIVGICFFIEANRRARERDIAASLLEARLARADLELLRWQLHPHFLFNALNTVSTLVLRGETQPADKAISLVSRYLRAALTQRADTTVALSEELATVSRYVEIERLRFGDLKVEMRIDEDARDGQVPGLIVQPLVENAIMHGAAHRTGGEQLTISASRNNGRLLISVANPGGSAQREDPSSDSNDERFGIRYVRERLKQFYGDNARFDLSVGVEQTVATLDLPFSKGDQQS